ncbi:MAG TPA: M23 family metallopeptidase [Spirochaetes bacterium]|nr:M23 family metallopeptidase [Spirochaetota bacterium]
MKRITFKIFIITTVCFIFVLECVHAEELDIVHVFGNVLARKDPDPYARVRKGGKLTEDIFVKTHGDSEIVFRNKDRIYKLYPYSVLKIKKKPVLIYGKLSQSASGEFYDLPFYFSPDPVQGKTMKVIVNIPEDSQIGGINISSAIKNDSGYSNKLTFYDVGNGIYRALTGFDVGAPPVKYRLTITVKSKNGDYSEIIYPFFLKSLNYGKGEVTLTEDMLALFADSEQKRKERKILAGILSKPGSQALWEDLFLYPVKEPVTNSAFGKKRIYYIENSNSFTRYHRGMDLKGGKGDPVFSANRGDVVFSDVRITTGNSVVIDHGLGVFSLYFHLDSTSVSIGDRVEKGEKIGEVGSTGIAEGNHLHWGIFVNGIYVDPSDWTKREF